MCSTLIVEDPEVFAGEGELVVTQGSMERNVPAKITARGGSDGQVYPTRPLKLSHSPTFMSQETIFVLARWLE